jgi:lipopolysaccharide transport protein LptA
VANDLAYQQEAGMLLYTGKVRVDQDGRVLTCQRLEVDLDDDRQAETMTCTGDTRLNDPKAGRRIEGQRAVYHVERRQIDVFGDPVVMRDREGNQVRGRRAVYFLDDDKVEVKGQDEAAPAPQGTQGGGR